MAVPWPDLTLWEQMPQRMSLERRREFLRREKVEGERGEDMVGVVVVVVVLHWSLGLGVL